MSAIASPASFWARVRVGEGCWLWMGGKDDQGYGSLGWQGKVMRAHQVAWALSGLKLPADAQLRHLCPERACCNPEHLTIRRKGGRAQRSSQCKCGAMVMSRARDPRHVQCSRCRKARGAKRARATRLYFLPGARSPSEHEVQLMEQAEPERVTLLQAEALVRAWQRGKRQAGQCGCGGKSVFISGQCLKCELGGAVRIEA
jgi:hypothetical protein